jgi:hypothetical protein
MMIHPFSSKWHNSIFFGWVIHQGMYVYICIDLYISL